MLVVVCAMEILSRLRRRGRRSWRQTAPSLRMPARALTTFDKHHMPRLSPRLFLEARKHHALLPLILQTTRDIGSARNEFRWLKEHAIAATKQTASPARQGWRQRLRALCVVRGRGRPLQYLLGTEYFGNLEIVCKPGVLIPR